MSSARADLLDTRVIADIDALDLSLGKQRSLTLAAGGAGSGSGGQRLRPRVTRYKTSICIKMPCILEVDESHCEDLEQFAPRQPMPSDRVDASAKEATEKALGSGPFAAAIASGMGPRDDVDMSYHDKKMSRESDSILQSLKAKLNL